MLSVPYPIKVSCDVELRCPARLRITKLAVSIDLGVNKWHRHLLGRNARGEIYSELPLSEHRLERVDMGVLLKQYPVKVILGT